ncbi:hypothetical protein OAD13_00345 [Candidatus Pelagibacter sp.]|nr:hypothetical protein [Candidatus Pelagibacter sp.]
MNIRNLKYIKEFIKHNFKNFKKKDYKKNYKILVEVYNYKPSIIPISYLSNVLAQKYHADLIGYYPSFLNFQDKFKRLLFEKLNPYGLNKIYRSFGIEKFIIPKKQMIELKKYYLIKFTKKLNLKKIF